jgi:hypothetical protein
MVAGEMAAGEMAAGEMVAGEMVAGEMVAGETIAGDLDSGEVVVVTKTIMHRIVIEIKNSLPNEIGPTRSQCGTHATSLDWAAFDASVEPDDCNDASYMLFG